MGFSGMKGRVYAINTHCPRTLNGAPPSGKAVLWVDEVTRFQVNESAQKREYGHDKSFGWQDLVYGTKRCEITLDATIHRARHGPILKSGMVLYLVLRPLGMSCGGRMGGWAGIDRVSYTVDQNTGEPVSYTITMSSKGKWRELSPKEWGGFECGCGGGSDGSGGSGGSSGSGGSGWSGWSGGSGPGWSGGSGSGWHYSGSYAGSRAS